MTDNMRLHNIPDEFSKKLEIELGATNWLIPETDIFDEPTRCYKINLEWSPIVMGMVSLLTEVGAWKEAQDETYPPILMVRRFLQGVTCMTYNLRQSPTDDCILQESTDGGDTWTDVFDFSLCLAPHIETINNQLTTIELQNIINSGYSFTQTTPTGENGVYTDEELAETSVEADVCDTDGKDAIYGAIDRLVRYIHGKNIDFLQQVSQGANIAQQIERAISATPVIGLLPADELAGYIGFIVDELSQEYNATVDEDLLQTVICDLFCIAVNSDCMFSLGDVYSYFADKVSPSLALGLNTFANFVQFGLTGTFSGDDYFYYLCHLQLAIAGTKQRFLDIQSVATYEQQMAAGFNSPDNDWSIFCTSCPPQYRLYTWDFRSQGQGDWYGDRADNANPPDDGLFVSGKGWKFADQNRVEIAIRHDPAWTIVAVAALTDFPVVDLNGRSFQGRPTAGSLTGNQLFPLSTGTGEYNQCRDTGFTIDNGYTEVAFAFQVVNNTSVRYLQKVAILYEAYAAPAGAIITEDNTLCS